MHGQPRVRLNAVGSSGSCEHVGFSRLVATISSGLIDFQLQVMDETQRWKVETRCEACVLVIDYVNYTS